MPKAISISHRSYWCNHFPPVAFLNFTAAIKLERERDLISDYINYISHLCHININHFKYFIISTNKIRRGIKIIFEEFWSANLSLDILNVCIILISFPTANECLHSSEFFFQTSSEQRIILSTILRACFELKLILNDRKRSSGQYFYREAKRAIWSHSAVWKFDRIYCRAISENVGGARAFVRLLLK